MWLGSLNNQPKKKKLIVGICWVYPKKWAKINRWLVFFTCQEWSNSILSYLKLTAKALENGWKGKTILSFWGLAYFQAQGRSFGEGNANTHAYCFLMKLYTSDVWWGFWVQNFRKKNRKNVVLFESEFVVHHI